MNKQEFDLWIASDEGKAIVTPFIDSKVSQGIKTYQSKHPTKDDLGERLDAIQAEIDKKELALKQNDLRFFAYKRCIENNIDYSLLDGYPLEDEKAISDKIDQLSTIQSKATNKVLVENLISKVRPQSGQQRETPNKDYNYYLNEAEERDRQSR